MREIDYSKYDIFIDGTIMSKRYKKDISRTTVSKAGYYISKLACVDGTFITVSVHRIIAKKFIDNPLDLKTVNHIDGDKLNNSVSNLEWMTTQDNCIHYTSSTDRWILNARELLHSCSELISLERVNNRSLITYFCRVCGNKYKTRLDSSIVERGLCNTCSKKKNGDSSAKY